MSVVEERILGRFLGILALVACTRTLAFAAAVADFTASFKDGLVNLLC